MSRKNTPRNSIFSAVHIALRLLRRVQHNVEPIKELAAPLLATFGSYHGEVRYEARALFIQLIHSHISNYLFAGNYYQRNRINNILYITNTQ